MAAATKEEMEKMKAEIMQSLGDVMTRLNKAENDIGAGQRALQDEGIKLVDGLSKKFAEFENKLGMVVGDAQVEFTNNKTELETTKETTERFKEQVQVFAAKVEAESSGIKSIVDQIM